MLLLAHTRPRPLFRLVSGWSRCQVMFKPAARAVRGAAAQHQVGKAGLSELRVVASNPTSR